MKRRRRFDFSSRPFCFPLRLSTGRSLKGNGQGMVFAALLRSFVARPQPLAIYQNQNSSSFRTSLVTKMERGEDVPMGEACQERTLESICTPVSSFSFSQTSQWTCRSVTYNRENDVFCRSENLWKGQRRGGGRGGDGRGEYRRRSSTILNTKRDTAARRAQSSQPPPTGPDGQ